MELDIYPYRFLAEQRVVVCVLCQFGNVADEAESHLAAQPHGLPWKERRRVAANIRQLPGVLASQSDLAGFRFPPPDRTSNPLLGEAETDGLACTTCEYVCRAEKKMKAHCRTQHGWVNQRPRGRVSPKLAQQVEGVWQEVPWRVGVRCQRFFRSRAASRWFEVEREGGNSTATATAAAAAAAAASAVVSSQAQGSDVSGSGWEDVVQRHETALEAEAEGARRTADGRTGVDFESTWIRTIGAAKHLAGKDLLALWRATAEPMTKAARAKIQDEAVRVEQDRMMRLVESVDREMERCQRRLELVPDEALAWLASVEVEKQGNRAFKASENASTLRRYASWWKSYLCYCVRACRLGRDEAEEAWGVRFTDHQWDELCAIVEGLFSGGGGLDDSGIDLGDLGDLDADDDHDRDREGQREAALDRHVFRFSVASIRQKVGFGIYKNPLVHFMVVVAWDGVSKMWLRDAGAVTTKYAGLLWCARLFMLEHVFGVELGIDQAADPDEEVHFGAVEHFRAQVGDWLARGSFTPASQMIKWMAYGKGHRRKEGGTPRLMWEADEKTMRYLGQPLKTVDFCRAAREGVREAAELLDQLLGGRWAELEGAIDVRRIKDDLTKGPAGHSFASNEENAWLRCGPRRAMELAGRRLWDVHAGRWRVGQVKRWLAVLREFKLAQMGNVHVWGGQPGRGPEVATMRHRDGEQLIRNVFVFDGQVLLITDRDKSKAIRDIGIKVARFLPAHVGKMVIAYIAWLAPLEELLLRQDSLAEAVGRGGSSSGGGGTERADAASQRLRTAQLLRDGWLWMDARPGFKGRWETPELSKRLVSLTGRFAAVELGTADYRHVSIAMGRKIKGLVVKQIEAVDDGEDWEDDGAGDEELTRINKFDFVFDIQSTHGRKIAARHYAVNVMFPNNLGPDKIESFREVSRLWHCFLEQRPADAALEDRRGGSGGNNSSSSSSEANNHGRKRARSESHRTRSQGEPPNSKRPKLDDQSGSGVAIAELDGALQQMLGRAARWKTDEQREGMQRIMAMKDGDVLIVVLPTGGGKSIFFMLPSRLASERGGVSIVVVPFVALIDDLVTRAKEAGIDCLRWASAAAQAREHPQRLPQLLVVSADVASTDEFIVHADMIRARGRLRRIFIDECHTVIMDVGYRRRLEELRGVHRYGCPVILLTATLPVRLEGWFRGLMIADKADLVRATTCKTNIRYRVRTVERGRGTVDGGVTELARKLGARMTGDQKGVVYCRSKLKSETLAEAIGCRFYHSELEGSVRQRVLAEWSRGGSESRWIVATTGLGTGIDIGGIVAIIHAEQPYGLVDFVQQTGRGGRREGDAVDSFIVTDGRKAFVRAGGSNAEHENRLAMERFIQADGCRRIPLGAFMDGAGRSCREVGGALCDQCHDTGFAGGGGGDGSDDETADGDETNSGSILQRTGRQGQGQGQQQQMQGEGIAPVVNAYGEEQRRRQTRLDLLRQWLVRTEGRCGTCYLRWLRRGAEDKDRWRYKHRPTRCKTVTKEEYLSWRVRIRFAEGACCWKCGLPQAWCESAETRSDCAWKDQVLPVVMSAAKSEALREIVKDRFMVDSFEAEAYTAWLGRSARRYGQDMTNALLVWDELVCRFFTEKERRTIDE